MTHTASTFSVSRAPGPFQNLTRAGTALSVLVGLLASVASSNTAQADVLERVVAVVNEEAVFLSELRRRASPFVESVVSQVPADQAQKQVGLLYDKIMGQLVDEILIEQTATELRISVTALEVDQALDNVRQQNNLEEDQFWEAVREQGFSPKQYRADVRKQLLRLKVINQKVRSRVNVSPDEVQEAYNDTVRKARRAQRFHAAHLFYELAPDAPATLVSQTLKRAHTERAALTADNFSSHVQELAGGDLGWLNQGDLPAELENALLDLAPGDISQPVRGPSGIHVFHLRERKQGGSELPSFEASKAGLEQALMGRAMQRQEAIFLDQLRGDAVIDKRL